VLAREASHAYRLLEHASGWGALTGHSGVGLPTVGGDGPHVYRTAGAIGRGSAGEVWRAVRVGPDGADEAGVSYVLKRLRPGALASGLREMHFGRHPALRGPHVVRFVESFVRGGEGVGAEELWLVFLDAGVPLNLLFFAESGAGSGASLL